MKLPGQESVRFYKKIFLMLKSHSILLFVRYYGFLLYKNKLLCIYKLDCKYHFTFTAL